MALIHLYYRERARIKRLLAQNPRYAGDLERQLASVEKSIEEQKQLIHLSTK